MAPSRSPQLAQPSRFRLSCRGLQRQHESCRSTEMTVEQAQDARTLKRIVDLGIAEIDVLRYQALLNHPIDRILVSGLHVIGHDSSTRGNPLAKRCASLGDGRWTVASRAIRLSLRQIGTPSRRQYSENAQRGMGSPGNHLP